MHKVAILVARKTPELAQVYDRECLRDLANLCGQATMPLYGADQLDACRDSLRDVETLFSTWNMPVLDERRAAELFPSLKSIYYAAGTVKYFAEPYMRRGVRVFSAAPVNAEAVADYAASLILLATKGFFSARVGVSHHFFAAKKMVDGCPGNHGAVVGVLGAGNIGRGVVARLKGRSDAEVLVYDPYVDEKACRALGARKATIEEVFTKSDVVSNHMPDLPETRGQLDASLFDLMKPTAAFVNTARGAQVVERDLAVSLARNPRQAAVLDVTDPEPIRPWSPLLRRRNCFVSPHIAGSTGNEKSRLGRAMVDAYAAVSSGGSSDLELLPDSLTRSA